MGSRDYEQVLTVTGVGLHGLPPPDVENSSFEICMHVCVSVCMCSYKYVLHIDIAQAIQIIVCEMSDIIID